MRQRMLLVLLALALPTAALADPVGCGGPNTQSERCGTTVVFGTGDFAVGSANSTSNGVSLSVTIMGLDNSISFQTGPLIELPASDCAPDFTCFEFTGGSVNVIPTTRCRAAGCIGSLMGTLMGGIVDLETLNNVESVSVDATLKPPISFTPVVGGPQIIPFATGNLSGSWTLSVARTMDIGSLTVTAEPVPELGTLGMLATGLVGLAGIARRKLIERKARI